MIFIIIYWSVCLDIFGRFIICGQSRQFNEIMRNQQIDAWWDWIFKV
jgi:hypothetical protein